MRCCGFPCSFSTKAEGRTNPYPPLLTITGTSVSKPRATADKYSVNTYRATVRLTINGHSQTDKTEVRAPSTQDARWLLWVTDV